MYIKYSVAMICALLMAASVPTQILVTKEVSMCLSASLTTDSSLMPYVRAKEEEVGHKITEIEQKMYELNVEIARVDRQLYSAIAERPDMSQEQTI